MSNPTGEVMNLEVAIEGIGLQGATNIAVPPRGREVYQALFSPNMIGASRGSVVFFHPIVGEFWYELTLNATKPEPTHLKTMECELGRCATLHEFTMASTLHVNVPSKNKHVSCWWQVHNADG